jgi:hypothetical protein
MALVHDLHVRGIAISALALAALVSGDPSFSESCGVLIDRPVRSEIAQQNA